ncbi:PRC-barrel domain-containing protein [Noviherbaspirillum sp.]|jgi:sporulation protein YlmC with PRC-barrel domain|uniref:PRC-barrel domain-containing protein n=1 Tax=Noviherbaspirillum sp. TaxID=1926288 RepID=UPI0025F2E8AA|nr:PRC-barrel domain-containing protein [Noviherbaspirillum sp.]
MEVSLRIGLLALAAVGFGAGGVAAQPSALSGSTENISAQQEGNSVRQQHLYRGSKIIGANVRNPQNEKIGVIRDLILDSRRGEIAYAVVRFGGVADAGKKYHPIPWQALQPSDDGTFYTLQADRETLGHAPGFDKRKWPDMADQQWSADVDRFWSRRVGRGTAGNNNLSPGGAASGVSGTSGMSSSKGASGTPAPAR